ncbi:type II secretion system minor pseudopilin GspK [Derxia gummosa]|uniref:Type II secretion system protein K n=1 Tax=Derxia gummosa DSM 723 TaxID=1121388 RepID=A0A8B6XA22_9BURK|nr:type II secretion system minor pseudopilin GspK [Derxia gummosa]
MAGMRAAGRRTPAGARRAASQRGVAVITALLIVALATIAVTGLLWRQQVQARMVENHLALGQDRWLARAAIDWARLVLKEDNKNSHDHLGEVWAVPIAETRISDAQGSRDREAWLSGAIADEQAKFNLLNLLDAAGRPDTAWIARFQRLLVLEGLSGGLAAAAAEALTATQTVTDTSTGQTRQPTQLPWLGVDDLGRLSGVDSAAIEKLRPFVTVLPRMTQAVTQVNCNTASAEVLHATIDNYSASDAARLVALRQRTPFVQTSQCTLPDKAPENAAALDVKSSFFRVTGRVRYERALLLTEALVYRESGSARTTRVLWSRED